MTPDSVAQARSLIESGTVDLFTVDLFDTLLLRRCTDPDGVFERAFDFAPVARESGALSQTYLQHRQLAERRARERRAATGAGGEVTIDEIYAQFPTHVFDLDVAARPALVEAEFEAEQDLGLINPDVAGLLRLARGRGITVGVVSDTYWPSERLRRLIAGGAPDLALDFISASCDHRTGKTGGLFDVVLAEQAVPAARHLHMGDNSLADIVSASRRGSQTVFYPQAPVDMLEVFDLEQSMLRVIQAERGGTVRRVDGGLRLVRRFALGALGGETAADVTAAVSVMGPVLLSFVQRIAARRDELAAQGRRVAVVFLGRDGYLPLRLWTMLGLGEGSYAEINRRAALVSAAHTIEPIQDFVRNFRYVDAKGLRVLLGIDLPGLDCEQVDKTLVGDALADALPDLIDLDEIARIATDFRGRLVGYLRAVVDGFDAATDVIVADLGYAGTIQRCLRRVFDAAGIDKALHGVYLLSVNDSFPEFTSGDSVRSLIDETIIPPIAKRTVLRNVGMFDRLCAAPWGSVLSYEGGRVVRDEDRRAPEQVDRVEQMQGHCLRFGALAVSLAERCGLDPFADTESSRLWSAVLLSRLLMMPTAPERRALGAVQNDVNLGYRTIIGSIDAPSVERVLEALPLSRAFEITEKPMWLAASIGELSPLASFVYSLTGFGIAPMSIQAESRLGEVSVTIFPPGGQVITAPVEVRISAFGDLRLRIPVLRRDAPARVAVPLDGLFPVGVVRSIAVQEGEGASTAMRSLRVDALPLSCLMGIGVVTRDGWFRAESADAHLIFEVPAPEAAVTVVTLTMLPLASEI